MTTSDVAYDDLHVQQPHYSPHSAVPSQEPRVVAVHLRVAKVRVTPPAVHSAAGKVGPLQRERHTFKEGLRPAAAIERCRVEGTVSLQRHVGGI